MTTRLRIARLDSASYWTNINEIEKSIVTRTTILKNKGDEVEITLWGSKTIEIREDKVPEDYNV